MRSTIPEALGMPLTCYAPGNILSMLCADFRNIRKSAINFESPPPHLFPPTIFLTQPIDLSF